MLQQILEDMFVDPELLEMLSKEQKEVLFHKIREEQLRRWKPEFDKSEAVLTKKPRKPAKLKFTPFSDIFFYEEDDAKAAEANKRFAEAQKQREQEELEEDARQSKILAQIQIQDALEREKAAAAARAEQLRKDAEEETRRLKELEEKERKEQMQRETYMSAKEAKQAAETEAKQRAEREAAAKKHAEERKKEEERIMAEQKAKEAKLMKEQKVKEDELYMTMRETREQTKKLQQEQEAKLDQIFKLQEAVAKKAEEEQRQAAIKARQEAAREASKASQSQGLSSANTTLERRRQAEAEAQAKLERDIEEMRAKSRVASTLPPKAPSAAVGAPPRGLPPKPGASTISGTSPSGRPIMPPPNAAAPPPGSLSRSQSAKGNNGGDPDSRTVRPTSENDVIAWFKATERPKGIGRDAAGHPQIWFHGLISREDSEKLLAGQPVGAFLLRVSTRIFGYTLSFVDKDRFKHFLVDYTDGMYSVFGGAESRSHPDVNTLIKFHANIAVSKTGTKLTKAIGDAKGNKSAAILLM